MMERSHFRSMRKSAKASFKVRYMIMLLTISVIFIIVGVTWEKEKISPKPIFSIESGFYKENFYLQINGDAECTIYYTLDGSEPNENSKIYQNPILIDNATNHVNIHSMRIDTSTGFYQELQEQCGIADTNPGYKMPDYLIDKCTVVRAVAVSKSGMKSEEVCASYFVGIEPEEYDGCKIISLITDPDNLFNSEYGIYVTGDVFKEYMKGNSVDDSWSWWLANYRMQGAEWEREVFLHFFDEKGALILSQESGVRIHGGVSRGVLPKSLNLYSRREYDGKERFEFKPFDNGYSPKRITLSNGGNQTITQFNDFMMTERTGEKLNFSTLSHQPCVLFINGEYWGFYWLNEKYDEKYLAYYYDVNEDNVIIMKNNKLEEGEEGEEKLFYDVEDYIINHDMSIDEYYSQACEMIDIESYIDYHAVLVYIARQEDWPFSNWAAWRTRDVRNEQYSDGRWRWLLFDCNSSSMGNTEGLLEHNTLEFLIESSPMFASLWKNENFQNKFKEKIYFVAENCFEANEMNKYIDEYNAKMIPKLSKSWKRFYGSTNDKLTEFYTIMERQRTFFERRRGVVESWF